MKSDADAKEAHVAAARAVAGDTAPTEDAPVTKSGNRELGLLVHMCISDVQNIFTTFFSRIWIFEILSYKKTSGYEVEFISDTISGVK